MSKKLHLEVKQDFTGVNQVSLRVLIIQDNIITTQKNYLIGYCKDIFEDVVQYIEKMKPFIEDSFNKNDNTHYAYIVADTAEQIIRKN